MYTCIHLLQFLNAVICSLVTLFFKSIKLHQILSQFSTINLAQALGIISFDEIIQISIIPSLSKILISIQGLLWRIGTTSNVTKRRTLLALHFLKNILPWIFFSLLPKESFAPMCTSSINFRNQMKLSHRIDLVDAYCH